jgi:hypothetical protein
MDELICCVQQRWYRERPFRPLAKRMLFVISLMHKKEFEV